MRRAPLLLTILAAACSSGHGRSNVHAYGFRDANGYFAARVLRTIHGDGSETVHGEAVQDYTPALDVTLRVIDDVELDPTGRLVSADTKVWNTFGTTDQKKRVILDPQAGTVKVTRPGGSTVWHVPAGADPWAYYHLDSDAVFGMPETSPAAAWVMARAAGVSTSLSFVIYDDLAALPAAGLGGGKYEGIYFAGYDSFDVDTEFVSSMTLGAVGVTATRSEGDPGPVASFDVPEGAYDLTFPDCSVPGTVEPLMVTSSDGQVVRGEVDLPTGGATTHTFVVFNAGSGGADRDEVVGGLPRWACLAKPLVAAGAAVVRYDDRGHGLTGGSIANVTFHQRTLDAIAVAKAVAARGDLATGHLILLGHSEGVAHVCEAATAVPEVSALALVAGVGTNGESVWQTQFATATQRYGMPQSWIDATLAQRATIAQQILNGTYPQSTFGGFPVQFWREFFQLDGAADAAAAARPAAIFQGEADWQVEPPLNADRLAAALTGAGVADVSEHLYPGDGHFLSAAPAGYPSTGDEYWVPKSWDPQMVSDLVAFVTSH